MIKFFGGLETKKCVKPILTFLLFSPKILELINMLPINTINLQAFYTSYRSGLAAECCNVRMKNKRNPSP